MSKAISEEKEETQQASNEKPSENEIALPTLASLLRAVSDKFDADMFLYSGRLDREGAVSFIEVTEVHKKRPNAILVLTTHGGTADAAYKMARHLKRTYQRFTLFVFGPCKSAGTLLAIGADEIVMSGVAEFGPLDVQLLKRDDLFYRNSGLDIAEALRTISEHAFTLFEKQFIEMIMRSNGAISTKTASGIAREIAVGLLAPITAQVDPIQIGEVRRAVRIAKDYASRLKGNPNTIQKLVEGYPSHSFVIDIDEAQELFENVRLTHPLEELLAITLSKDSEEGTGHECVREPYPHNAIVMPLNLFEESEKADDGEDVEQQAASKDSDGESATNGEEVNANVTND